MKITETLSLAMKHRVEQNKQENNNSRNKNPVKQTKSFKNLINKMKGKYKKPPQFLHFIRDKVEKPKIVNNGLNIKKGQIFGLGKYDGVKIVAKRDPDTGTIGCSNCPTLKGDGKSDAGEKVSMKDRIAAKLTKSFSAEQNEAITDTATTLTELLETAEGKHSVKEFNDFFDRAQNRDINIAKELKRVGIDPTKPFKINGTEFKLEQGKLYKV